MGWLQVTVRVSRDRASTVEDTLEELSALAVTLTDDADDPVLEPGIGEIPLWPTVCVTGLFPSETERGSVQTALSSLPELGRPEQIEFHQLEDQDWVRSWLDGFKPMRFGDRLWVVPGDMEPPPGGVSVLLDPGLAFGTGTHPTTSLCLEWLDQNIVQGADLIDFGCGSGILAIAALKLGAGSALAIDHDPQALEATGSNALRNDVAERLRISAPGEVVNQSADVVMANILAGPLVKLAEGLVARTRAGGCVVLSGILPEQAQGVVKAYAQCGVEDLSVLERDGWVRISGSVAN